MKDDNNTLGSENSAVSLAGKVVIITGGALGTGRYCAQQFAKDGAHVAIADINEPGLKEVEAMLAKISDTKHLVRRVDIRNQDEVKAFVDEIAKTFSRIDVLMNNAAVVPHAMWMTQASNWPPIKDMDYDFWRHVFAVQLDGTFFFIKYVVPHMEAGGGGHIINVMNSGANYIANTARLSSARRVPYTASKVALHNMTQYVGEDLRDSNICVVGVSGEAFAADHAPEEARKRMPGPEVLGQALPDCRGGPDGVDRDVGRGEAWRTGTAQRMTTSVLFQIGSAGLRRKARPYVRYRQLGRSGLTVSVVGIGCNSFGLSCDEPTVKAIVDTALEHGVIHFDAAPGYGEGRCEAFLGSAIAGRRDEVVIATKAGGFTSRSGSNARGSRRSIVRSVEGSLERLKTDFIDLLYLHQPDPATPMEETLGAMDDLVRAGKVRYVASSNLKAWQIVEAEWIARQAGGTRFVASQNAYSLIDRQVELDIAPVCEHYGIGVVPYFPLAHGLLTGTFKRGETVKEGSRLGRRPAVAENTAALDAMEALEAFARTRGASILDVAIGGLAAKPAVASVIAGVSRPEQVVTNARASDWIPSDEDAAALDAISPPAKYAPLGSRTASLR